MKRQSEQTEDFANREFLQGKDLSRAQEVGRPEVPAGLSDTKDDLTFMQIDCDYYTKSK
jgi:hypothetical protein